MLSCCLLGFHTFVSAAISRSSEAFSERLHAVLQTSSSCAEICCRGGLLHAVSHCLHEPLQLLRPLRLQDEEEVGLRKKLGKNVDIRHLDIGKSPVGQCEVPEGQDLIPEQPACPAG